MLIKLPDDKITHAQCAYWQDEQVKELTNMYKTSAKINPLDLPVEDIDMLDDEIKNFISPGDTYGFLEAVKFVISTGKAGSSYLQRYLHIGYNRAAEYMDLLRERGVIPK